jgi:GNAT superfamily N-acetyltransferase
VSADIRIRPASPAEIDELKSIDDDAGGLFEAAGLHLDLPPDHPFTRAERACWLRCAEAGNALLAEEVDGRTVGLLVMDRIDGAPYLEQLSVRMRAQGRGLGRRLLARAIEWAPGEDLWLTTYGHLAWNRPFYERHGFVVVPEPECPPGMVAILEDQRHWLPAPDQRIAMRLMSPRPAKRGES